MRRTSFLLTAAALVVGAANLSAQTSTHSTTLAAPPVAPVRPVTDNDFGTKVVDNYRYFENLKDPEVQAWMKGQADYTRAVLDHLPGRAALVERLTKILESQAQFQDAAVVSGRYYTLRTPVGAQSPKLYVRDGLAGRDRLLVDPEALGGPAGSHLSIKSFTPSPDGRLIAYGLSAGGSEVPTLQILDVATGKDLPGTAERVGFAGAQFWRADSKSFYYFRLQKFEPGMPPTAKMQNARVYLHVLGHPFDSDRAALGTGVSGSIPLTAEEFPTLATAPTSHYAVAFVGHGVATQLRVYAARDADVAAGHAVWRPIAPSYDDQFIGGDNPDQVGVALAGDTLFWLSRKTAPRGEILALDLSQPESQPRVVVPQGELRIAAAYAAPGALYWRVEDAGIAQAWRLRLRPGAAPEHIALPFGADITNIVADQSGSATLLYATSWTRALTPLAVNANAAKATDAGLVPAGSFDHPDVVAEEVKVQSWDGTMVPLSIIHRPGLALDGSHPTIVDGYGAYGIKDGPLYFPVFQAWYERGGIIAIAHVRGGGEYGEAWHHTGFQQSKPNTWKDFIACAEYLVAHGYTSPAKLAGRGGSAGGITIGRAIEERPDLFAVALAVVPLADALRFETTPNGPPNVPEFGSVKTEAGFRALLAMSPYANVRDGVKYPAVLVTTGINDPRVAPWIPAKFAARLQAATASGKPVLLRVDYDAGHASIDATTRQQALVFADDMSFVLWQTGDPAFQPSSP